MAMELVEIPSELVAQIRQRGFANVVDFLKATIQTETPQYSVAEMLAAIEEDLGLLSDTDLTMDDILEMKHEERALEERKMNRFS